jgi:hypothetical protein
VDGARIECPDLPEEIGEIVSLGEAGELRRVVQSHVHDFLDAGV